MSALAVQLERPGAGFLELSREQLDAYAGELAGVWAELGVGAGDRVAIYDYGSSPLAYLASRAFAPHLERGAAERLGATALCVDGLPDNAKRFAHVLRHFRPGFAFVRADLVPLLVCGPTAVAAELRAARLVVSADEDAPGPRQRAEWEREWGGGVSLLERRDASRHVAVERSPREPPLRAEAQPPPRQAAAPLRPAGREGCLDAVETRPLEHLEAAALERLGEVLERAARLPFYRGRLAGLSAAAASESFESFAAAVPAFRKSDLIAELKRTGGHTSGIEALDATGPAAVVLTSGTLGFPTFASLGAGELEHGSSREVLRELWMDGMRPGMRVMCQYPAWHHLSMLDNRALEWLEADVVCPWGTFVPRFADRAIELIAARRPEYLLTVTTMLHAIVERALGRGLDPLELFEPVRYAMVAGEPVSPGQRRLLVELLGLEDLFERGGSSDGLWGAAECPAHRGHHVWLDHHWLEVVDPESGEPLPPGRRGSVVVTNLSFDRSLYVRFDTEDLGELLPGPCPCGRTHPRLELHGRLADCVRVEGRLIAPYDVRALLDEVPGLVGLPLVIVREAPEMDRLEVRLDGGARAEPLAELAAEQLREGLGVPAEVRWGGRLPRRWKARMTTAGSRTPVGGGRWRRR
jgi:phenylacetate-CoA ligase